MSLVFELVNDHSTNETHTSYDYYLKEIEMKVTTGSSQDSSHVIQKEKLALNRMKPNLVDDPAYSGKYVAVRNGEIVGVHDDWSSLAESTYREFGYVPILIEKIQPVPSKVRIGRPRIR